MADSSGLTAPHATSRADLYITLREIAGHLNRLVQQQEKMLDVLRLQAGLRQMTREERQWVTQCHQEDRSG